jgi:hypothetical protein
MQRTACVKEFLATGQEGDKGLRQQKRHRKRLQVLSISNDEENLNWLIDRQRCSCA